MFRATATSSDEEEEAFDGKADEQYKYTYNLTNGGEIRVLHLNPGRPDQPIEIWFSLKPLATYQNYSALSYTWGNPKPRKRIYVCDPYPDNPDDFRQWMAVTPNLEAALRQLRHPRKSLELWVDALCINQDEGSEEKGPQIQQMDQIYSQAKQVIVWLGESSEDSSLAMKFIREVSDLSKLDKITKDLIYRKKWNALSSLMRRPWFSRRWVVQELAMAKAAFVHCGSENVNWSDFADAVALFEAKYQDIQTLFDNDSYLLGEIQGLGAHSLMTASHNLFAHSKQGISRKRLATLEYLLCTLSAFKVTNPWDTVYSLLGLASDVRRRSDNDISAANEEQLAPEGTSTIAVEGAVTNHSPRRSSSEAILPVDLPKGPRIPLEGLLDDRRRKVLEAETAVDTLFIPVDYKEPLMAVLIQVVIYTIKQSSCADIICRPWAPSETQFAAWKSPLPGSSTYNLPSWIRDTVESEFAPRSDRFGVQYDRINAKSFLGNPGSPIYKAAGARSRANPVLKEIGADITACLVLDGYFIDYVGEHGGYASSGQIPPDWLSLASWTDHRTSPTPDSFWRTLVADRGLDGGRPPVWYRRACEHAWSESASPGLDIGRVVRNYGSSMTAEFMKRVRQTVWNRQMFLTRDKKMLGLGPSNSHSSLTVRADDLIFVLHGCSVPVILRLHPYHDCYTLVGECFVHGIMDGETFEENGRAEKKLREVWLL